ncbi:MAG: LysM peptidoglycan-binding domain-containing protein, partial [Kiritimatiellae bacterium]|nr:LysM peptidoglycan-binding domain-containing protein [Kiritimatiellia bacterium]
MKKPWLIALIVGAHFVVLGLILLAGCRTTPQQPVTEAPSAPVLPPPAAVPKTPEPPVQPSPPTVPTKTWPTETTTYVVAPGDTLEGIARRHGFTVSELATLNGISNPNRIRVGQKLVLPGRVEVKPPPKKKPVTPRPTASPQAKQPVELKGDVYVVRPGDSLWKIASMFKTSVKALMEANALKSERLQVGQKLKIPGSAAATAAGAQQQPSAPTGISLDTPPVLEPPVTSTVPTPRVSETNVPPVSRLPDTGVGSADVSHKPPKTATADAPSYRLHTV